MIFHAKGTSHKVHQVCIEEFADMNKTTTRKICPLCDYDIVKIVAEEDIDPGEAEGDAPDSVASSEKKDAEPEPGEGET